VTCVATYKYTFETPAVATVTVEVEAENDKAAERAAVIKAFDMPPEAWERVVPELESVEIVKFEVTDIP